MVSVEGVYTSKTLAFYTLYQYNKNILNDGGRKKLPKAPFRKFNYGKSLWLYRYNLYAKGICELLIFIEKIWDTHIASYVKEFSTRAKVMFLDFIMKNNFPIVGKENKILL